MKKGFTLIELLITISILTLLFFGGYTAYRDFARRQVLENTYKELNTNLSYARELALSGEKPAGCTQALSGYAVRFQPDLSLYSIAAVCGPTIDVRAIKYPPGINITSSDDIVYKVLGQGTTLLQNAQIVITQTQTGKKITASVSKVGVLEK